MSTRYRVRQGCNVISPDGQHVWKGGSIIPLGMSDAILKDLERSGHIERAREAQAPQEIVDPALMPGVDVRPIQAESNESPDGKAINVPAKAHNAAGVVTISGPVGQNAAPSIPVARQTVDVATEPMPTESSAPAPSGTPGGAAMSQWNLDPSTLQGKKVEDLNIMVAERDSTVAPFATPEEAVAFLSQDFVPSK